MLRSSIPTTVRRPKGSPIPLICPPSIVANRRLLATRIAVTRGTASLRSTGIGPFGSDAAMEGERTTRTASGLSAGAVGRFRAGVSRGSGTAARGGALTAAGLGFGTSEGALTAGGFGFGTAGGALTAAGFDFGAAGGALATVGVTRGGGAVAIRPGAGTLARDGGAGFDSGFFAFDSALFAASLTASRFGSDFFAASLTAG